MEEPLRGNLLRHTKRNSAQWGTINREALRAHSIPTSLGYRPARATACTLLPFARCGAMLSGDTVWRTAKQACHARLTT